MQYIPSRLPLSSQANLHQCYNQAQCAPADSQMVYSSEQLRNEFWNQIKALDVSLCDNPVEINIITEQWLKYLNGITGLLEFGTRLERTSLLSQNTSVCNFPYSINWKTGANIGYSDEDVQLAKKNKKDLPQLNLDLELCGDNETTIAAEMIFSRIAASNGISVSSKKAVADVRLLAKDNNNSPQKATMLGSILEKQFFALERLYKMNLKSKAIFSMLKDCKSELLELKPDYARALQIIYELNVASIMIEKAFTAQTTSEPAHEMITSLAAVSLPKIQTLAKYFVDFNCSLTKEVTDYCMVAELYFEMILLISTLNLNTAMVDDTIKNTKGLDIVKVENNLIAKYLQGDFRAKIHKVDNSFTSNSQFNGKGNLLHLQSWLTDKDFNKRMADSLAKYENVKDMIDPVKWQNYTVETIKNSCMSGEDKILQHMKIKVLGK